MAYYIFHFITYTIHYILHNLCLMLLYIHRLCKLFLGGEWWEAICTNAFDIVHILLKPFRKSFFCNVISTFTRLASKIIILFTVLYIALPIIWLKWIKTSCTYTILLDFAAKNFIFQTIVVCQTVCVITFLANCPLFIKIFFTISYSLLTFSTL